MIALVLVFSVPAAQASSSGTVMAQDSATAKNPPTWMAVPDSLSAPGGAATPAGATGAQRTPTPPRVAGAEPTRYLQAVTARLRNGVQERRSAAFRHGDYLGLPRHKTAYRERQATGVRYLKWLRRLWAVRADRLWKLRVNLRDPDVAIGVVFGRYADQAKRVAACESGDTDGDLSPSVVYASNGQYQGMFQMGSSERAIYGHGMTPLEQARAAYRYFVASGRDWSPWQCRPWGLAW